MKAQLNNPKDQEILRENLSELSVVIGNDLYADTKTERHITAYVWNFIFPDAPGRARRRVMPRLLNLIVAIYLIAIGIRGL